VYSTEKKKGCSNFFNIGSPNVEFTEEEIESLKEYISSGNILILADNSTEGNSILKHLNISFRFSKLQNTGYSRSHPF